MDRDCSLYSNLADTITSKTGTFVPSFFICYNGDVMKKYVFKSQESCVKFLECLGVQIPVPLAKGIFLSVREEDVCYEVSVEGKVCHKAAIITECEPIKRYTFYSKPIRSDIKPIITQPREQADELDETIYRLRDAYQKIKYIKGGMK